MYEKLPKLRISSAQSKSKAYARAPTSATVTKGVFIICGREKRILVKLKLTAIKSNKASMLKKTGAELNSINRVVILRFYFLIPKIIFT